MPLPPTTTRRSTRRWSRPCARHACTTGGSAPRASPSRTPWRWCRTCSPSRPARAATTRSRPGWRSASASRSRGSGGPCASTGRSSTHRPAVAWSFGTRPTYVGAFEQGRPGDPAASTRHLVRRYLQAFGPATPADIAAFSTIYRPPVQAAVRELGDELVTLDGPGRAAGRPPGRSPARRGHAGPAAAAADVGQRAARVQGPLADHPGRLPAQRDPVERRRPADAARRRLRRRRVAPGRRRHRGDGVPPAPRRGVGGARGGGKRVACVPRGRDPAIYRRYWRWWAELPAAEVRRLG